MKVDFLAHAEGELRGDLEAVAFCEYVVGGSTARAGRSVPAGGVGKGRSSEAVRLFASHPLTEMSKQTQDKHVEKWLHRDAALGGQDRRRWTLEESWCVDLMRRRLRAKTFRRSPVESRHYRIRFCPETSAGHALANSDQMEVAARAFIAQVEGDYGGKFIWVAGAHYNTDNPHVHFGLRGIDVDGSHVYFQQRYLRPTPRELAANPAASSPIEWRARGVLAEMLSDNKSVRYAG